MKKVFLILFTASSLSANCCVSCSKPVRDAIYGSTFYPNFLGIFSAFIVLTVIILILSWVSSRRHKTMLAMFPGHLTPVPLTTCAMVLGIGLGGFADGIVLHQILQWHQMLTNKISATTLLNKNVNMFWDGIFHSFTLTATVIGVCLLWRLLARTHINRSGYLLLGGMLSGWGIFNLVEGIINHHILRLHNVKEFSSYSDMWNYGFLAFGLLLLAIGYLLVQKGRKNPGI